MCSVLFMPYFEKPKGIGFLYVLFKHIGGSNLFPEIGEAKQRPSVSSCAGGSKAEVRGSTPLLGRITSECPVVHPGIEWRNYTHSRSVPLKHRK